MSICVYLKGPKCVRDHFYPSACTFTLTTFWQVPYNGKEWMIFVNGALWVLVVPFLFHSNLELATGMLLVPLVHSSLIVSIFSRDIETLLQKNYVFGWARKITQCAKEFHGSFVVANEAIDLPLHWHSKPFFLEKDNRSWNICSTEAWSFSKCMHCKGRSCSWCIASQHHLVDDMVWQWFFLVTTVVKSLQQYRH